MNNNQIDKIIAAQGSRRVSECSMLEVNQMVQRLYAIAGNSISPEKKEEIKITTTYIKTSLSEYTLFEFELALDFFLHSQMEGFFPEKYTKICGAFLAQLMFHYSRMREEARRESIIKLDEHTQSDDEKQHLRRFYNIKFFRQYRDRRILHIPSKLVFEFLSSHGLIQFTPERQRQIEAKAEAEAAAMEKAQTGMLGMPKAKFYEDHKHTLLVKAFYDDLIETGQDIEEVLNG